ncbi:MAG: c-type cytochrome [Bryobacteraceae bacterium]
MKNHLTLVFISFTCLLHGQSADFSGRVFEVRCAGCHGTDGAGGEHGPPIVGERKRDGGARTQDLREIIRRGIPDGGMPAFPSLSESELSSIVSRVQQLRAPAHDNPSRGDVAAGAKFFVGEGNCAKCHIVNGRGGVIGPDLSRIGQERTIAQIEEALRSPGVKIRPGYQLITAQLKNGAVVRGLAKNESLFDLQLQSLEGNLRGYSRQEIKSIRREAGSLMPAVAGSPEDVQNLLAYLSRLPGIRPATATAAPSSDLLNLPFSRIATPHTGDWPTYNGLLSGNRMSSLQNINTRNVGKLAAKWLFSIPSARRLEVTPVVVDGVMFVTNANEAYALDAKTGRQIWRYARPLTPGVIGDAGSAINRGVAVLGDKVFMATDHAHLLALNRNSGQLIWEVEMADFREHYGTTSAPLVVNDLVLMGTSGGDEGARGFIDAYKADSGERAWRFWTMPKPGDPEAKTWGGRAIEHGCVAPWLTGTYDPEAKLIYWPTGNPCPDYNGDERKGDNLYSCSVLALDPETGSYAGSSSSRRTTCTTGTPPNRRC